MTNVPKDAELCICGTDVFFLHVDDDANSISLDTDDLSYLDEYSEEDDD
jgi:hypothetical protein